MAINLDDGEKWTFHNPPVTVPYHEMSDDQVIDVLNYLYTYYPELYRSFMGLAENNTIFVDKSVMLWWWVSRKAVLAVLMEIRRRGLGMPAALVKELQAAFKFGDMAVDEQHRDPRAFASLQSTVLQRVEETEQEIADREFVEEFGEIPRQFDL